MNIAILLSHILTQPQIDELKNLYRCENIIYMPEEIKAKWMNIDDNSSPEIFKEFLLANLKKGDYVLIQGEWGMTYKLINFAKKNGFIPLFSRTGRNVQERKEGDKTIKVSVFEHKGFRKYEDE